MIKGPLPNLVVSKEEAEKKIQSQIEKGQLLRDMKIDSETELKKAKEDSINWSRYNEKLLLKLFDTSSISDEYARCCIYPPTLLVSSPYEETRNRFLKDLSGYKSDRDRDINHLKGIHEQLELFDEPSDAFPSTFGNEVFIVHGRDNEAKETVARFVEKFGLKATILHEQPNEGRTIIEKLEDCADKAGFAIVLLTPDDIGTLKDDVDSTGKPRARQNVVFELGYFIGKLGRERVCPLFKGEIEKPSDIDGVIYVAMDSEGWKLQLGQEMKNAGFPIDMNKDFLTKRLHTTQKESSMPTLEFKGKQHIYAHHLTVPYRPLEPDESCLLQPDRYRRQPHHPRRQLTCPQSFTATLCQPCQVHLHRSTLQHRQRGLGV